MRRRTVVAIHAAYWTVFSLLALVLLLMIGRGQPDSRAPWFILTIVGLPAAAVFYTAYWRLFPIARRGRVFIVWCGLVSALGGVLGLAVSLLLYGAGQPVFSSPLETGVLLGSLAALSALHVAAALAIRGFIEWHRTRDAELALLRAKLHPHFLFNTLNNVDVLIGRDPEAASRYLNQLSDILRFALYETPRESISLADELAYMEKYIALERIRRREAGYVRYEVAGDPAALSIAPMTFIPLLENAFTHSEGVRGDDTIVSRVEIDGGRITFECVNRCAPAAPRPAGGLGSSLVRERLALLYPHRHTLTTERSGDTYLVRLTVQTA